MCPVSPTLTTCPITSGQIVQIVGRLVLCNHRVGLVMIKIDKVIIRIKKKLKYFLFGPLEDLSCRGNYIVML